MPSVGRDLLEAVQRAQCVGVVLLDPTAHAHGRMFMAALGADELPVQRVTFDASMIATVREAPEGLTIARSEESRGFLTPQTPCRMTTRFVQSLYNSVDGTDHIRRVNDFS